MVMASFGGACIAFAALALMRAPAQEAPEPVDPLGELVARSQPADAPERPRSLEVSDVSFPSMLSDKDDPTTAMAVLRGSGSPSASRAAAAPSGLAPAVDRLPSVSLPAQDVLHTSGGDIAESDTLRAIATAMARERDEEISPPGAPGGHQLQVSSFQDPEEAEAFATVLRRRGHRAHVASVHVKERGLWHRVRIGPFKYRRSAEIYRQDFEAKERMVAFVLDPPKATIRVGMADVDD